MNPPNKKQNYFLTKNLKSSKNDKISGLNTPSNKLKTKNISNLDLPEEVTDDYLEVNTEDTLDEDAEILENDEEDAYGGHFEVENMSQKKSEKFVVVPFNPLDPLGKKIWFFRKNSELGLLYNLMRHFWFLDKSVPEFPPGDSFHGSPPREHQDLFRRPLGTDNDGTFKHLLNVPEGTLKPESIEIGKQKNKPQG